jgi:hypothetical protein
VGVKSRARPKASGDIQNVLLTPHPVPLPQGEREDREIFLAIP